MRGAAVAILVLLLTGAGLGAYWHLTTSEVLEHTQRNLKSAQKLLKEAGEGVTLSWSGIERHPFPLGKGVRILKLKLERKSGKNQTISLAYLDVIPRNDELTRLQVEGPLKANAEDSYNGAFALEMNKFPSVMFRAPAEEKKLSDAKSFMGDRRTTPAELLNKLPEDIMHQYSVVMPPKFALTITYAGRKNTTDSLASSKTQLRNWQLIDYRIASDLDAFFSFLKREAYGK